MVLKPVRLTPGWLFVLNVQMTGTGGLLTMNTAGSRFLRPKPHNGRTHFRPKQPVTEQRK